MPLNTIGNVVNIVVDNNTPIFVYCHSGSRSRQACEDLIEMGYTNVKNIGGFAAYTGKAVR